MRVEQLSLFDIPAGPIKKQVCLSVGDFAKVLSSKGYAVGQMRLFDKLRVWKLIDKFNVPYQRYVEAGYFKIINERFSKGGRFPSTYLKILVTPNGQKYIEERYRNERDGNRA